LRDTPLTIDDIGTYEGTTPNHKPWRGSWCGCWSAVKSTLSYLKFANHQTSPNRCKPVIWP